MKKNPKVFEEMTLIAPSYRGLFGCDACPTPPTAAATEIIPPSVAGQLLSYANPVTFFSGSGNAIQSLLGGVESTAAAAASSSPGKMNHDSSAGGDTNMPIHATSTTTTAATITTSPSKNESNNATNTNNNNDISVKPVEITMVPHILSTKTHPLMTPLSSHPLLSSEYSLITNLRLTSFLSTRPHTSPSHLTLS